MVKERDFEAGKNQNKFKKSNIQLLFFLAFFSVIHGVFLHKTD